MPYLTLWDKILQNLAHLEGNSHKNFKSHIIFRPFYNRFYEEININHTLLWFSQTYYMKKDLSFNVMFKKISQNFVISPLNFCLISQVLVHSLWHVCIIGILWSFFKQCRPRSDATESWVWSGSPLFAGSFVYVQKSLTPLRFKIDLFKLGTFVTLANSVCLCWGFTAQTTQRGHVERGQFT